MVQVAAAELYSSGRFVIMVTAFDYVERRILVYYLDRVLERCFGITHQSNQVRTCMAKGGHSGFLNEEPPLFIVYRPEAPNRLRGNAFEPI